MTNETPIINKFDHDLGVLSFQPLGMPQKFKVKIVPLDLTQFNVGKVF